MHLPRITLGSLLLVVAALSVGFASLKGNYLWFLGVSLMTIVGLLGAAIGANSDADRSGPYSSGPSSAVPPF